MSSSGISAIPTLHEMDKAHEAQHKRKGNGKAENDRILPPFITVSPNSYSDPTTSNAHKHNRRRRNMQDHTASGLNAKKFGRLSYSYRYEYGAGQIPSTIAPNKPPKPKDYDTGDSKLDELLRLWTPTTTIPL